MNTRHVITASALVSLLGGCLAVTSEPPVLKAKDVSQFVLPPDIQLAREGWPDRCWWLKFQDAQLTQLIQQALKASPTLAAVNARAKRAEALLAASSAALGPQVSASGQWVRERFPEQDIYPPPLGGSWQSQPQLQISANLLLDWWGRNRDEVSAALGDHYASRADLAMAEQVLSAAIAQAYFTWQADQARLALLTQQCVSQQKQLDFMTKQVSAGLATITSQHKAEAKLAQLKEQHEAQQARVLQGRESLRALLGGGDAARYVDTLVIKPLPRPSGQLPPSLGLDLLARRADLQAARWRVEASLHRVEAAKKAFYPDVNLMAFFGYSMIGTENLLASANRFPGIGATFNLPIFNSGRLQADLDNRRARREEAIAEYNQALVNAVQDVADQGIIYQGLERQLQAQGLALKASQAILNNQKKRLARGLVGQPVVIEAQLADLEQQEQQLRLTRALLLSDVALIRALGGGYRVPHEGNNEKSRAGENKK